MAQSRRWRSLESCVPTSRSSSTKTLRSSLDVLGGLWGENSQTHTMKCTHFILANTCKGKYSTRELRSAATVLRTRSLLCATVASTCANCVAMKYSAANASTFYTDCPAGKISAQMAPGDEIKHIGWGFCDRVVSIRYLSRRDSKLEMPEIFCTK